MTTGATARVLIGGDWVKSDCTGTFRAADPERGTYTGDAFPISSDDEVSRCLDAGLRAAQELRSRPNSPADFLAAFADRITAISERLLLAANCESGLPIGERLRGELSRTTNQLRQASNAARTGSWKDPRFHTESNIRSILAPLGKPVAVFGPNNFPLAFNSISGGDFAAAVAAGNPVIAKGNSAHPNTTRLLAEAAFDAAARARAPRALVQLIYKTERDVGRRFVSDPRLGAVGFTGSRESGLDLKAAADKAGVLFYAEMGSLNPVFLLPGAVTRLRRQIVADLASSCLTNGGQFCTKPGLVMIPSGADGDKVVESVLSSFRDAEPATLLSDPTRLNSGIEALVSRGAKILVGGKQIPEPRFAFENTVLEVSGDDFVHAPDDFSVELFGPATVFVRTSGINEMIAVATSIAGHLTGTIYLANGEEKYCRAIAEELRPRVGRLLINKMPTGVAVVDSMNHGGPFPATGHPGFTAVGIPSSIRRFAALHCYDGVPEQFLPEGLQDVNAGEILWRNVDGTWIKGASDEPTT